MLNRPPAPRKSHLKNPSTPPKFCSDRCRTHKPKYSHGDSLEGKIEDCFVALLEGHDLERNPGGGGGGAGCPPSADTTTTSREKGKVRGYKKGDKSRIIMCTDVEAVVFQRGVAATDDVDDAKDAEATYNENPMIGKPTRKKPVRGLKEGEANTGNATGVDYSSSEDYASDDEVGGVPVHIEKLALQQVQTAAGVAKKRQPNVIPDRPITSEDKLRRREGQDRAKERELVRQAGRRGVAFGFVVDRTKGTMSSVVLLNKGLAKEDMDDGSGGQEQDNTQRRKVEIVQGGRVVEGSFAKGEWGVRWVE
ncbi:hypothetical protein MMC25_002965 [Agyrium rufum]|nr:hypothetical protein [Agyrium rufum]